MRPRPAPPPLFFWAMKFIIFICTRLSNGQYPRLPDFFYDATLAKYIYQGRELTLDEFNSASKVVFDQNYRSNGFHFCPMALDPPPPLPPSKVFKKPTPSP